MSTHGRSWSREIPQERVTAPAHLGRITALLWDLDNVTAGVVRDEELARQIVSRCHDSSLLFASGHRATYASHRDALTSAGIVVLNGGRRPEGADRRLLEKGHALAREGVNHFLVASNDRAFAHLPRTCSITVLTLTPSLVSERLRSRAREVIALNPPDRQADAP